jgi:DNA repair exonuclease SbcCD ATPase subunit
MNIETQNQKSEDAAALQEILSEVEKATAEYNTVLTEVRAHQEQLSKERTALGVLRTRLMSMREPLKRWDKSLWDVGWRSGVPRDARVNAERQIQAHRTLLDDLIWQLFEFREKPDAYPGEGR